MGERLRHFNAPDWSPACSPHQRAECKSCAPANSHANKSLTPPFNADRFLSILTDPSAVWRECARPGELSLQSQNRIVLRSDFAPSCRWRIWQRFSLPCRSQTASKSRVPSILMAARRVHFGLGVKLAKRFRFRNKRPYVTLLRWCRELAAIDPNRLLAPFTRRRTVQVNDPYLL